LPAQFSKWVFGKTLKVAKPFRVKQISSSHDYRREVTAIEYSEDLYLPPGATVNPIDYSDLNSRVVQQPAVTGVTERLVIHGGVIIPEVTVSYRSDQATFKQASVLVSTNGGPWEEKGTSFSSVTFMSAESAELRIRFVAFDRFGNSTPGAESTAFTYTVLGKTAAPSDVQGLNAQIKAGEVQRAIDAEGIAADRAQWEKEQLYPYQQVQYMQSLLQGLPIQTNQYNYIEPSGLSSLSGSIGSLLDLFNRLYGTGGTSGTGGGGTVLPPGETSDPNFS
jgi:hypothetical protein